MPRLQGCCKVFHLLCQTYVHLEDCMTVCIPTCTPVCARIHIKEIYPHAFNHAQARYVHGLHGLHSLQIIHDMHVWSQQYGHMWRHRRPTDSHSVTPINDARPPHSDPVLLLHHCDNGSTQSCRDNPFSCAVVHFTGSLNDVGICASYSHKELRGVQYGYDMEERGVRSISDDRVGRVGELVYLATLLQPSDMGVL